ncbi:MAG: ABC transporter substrate-binding protein, partial [Acidimicrobiia bacterium]|nr:ABC transporter substrate-binding protein [Acidimicrobiia bacterium]
MTQRRWLLMVSLLALIAAACSSDTTSPSTTAAGDTGATTPTTTSGSDDPGTTAASVDDYCADGADGTLIWAHEQEPPDLHLNDPNNNLSVTSYVWQVMWDDLYGISAALDFYPELLAEEGVVNDNGDGTTTIDFRLRDGLTWSDGEALTADDVKFTFDILMEGYDPESGGGIYLIGSRTGYDLITDFRVNSDTEFSIDFSAFYAGWKTLFTNVFPAHAFGEGAGATEVNEALSTWTNADGEILPSSGPMVFESWEQGVSMNFVRNDNYHGSVSPDTQNKGAACVSALKINWVTDTDAQINSLKSGEAHIIFTQPQLAFEEIGNDPAFTVAASPGPIWEHWGFNVLGV